MKIDHYIVQTTPIYLPQKGIEGNFFKIYPYFVNIWGTTRQDFNIHYDANALNSDGCVVIRNQMDWEAFETMMDDYKKADLS